jgi:hypothetical protein
LNRTASRKTASSKRWSRRPRRKNISNSRALITKPNATIGIVTNDFHMFRALQIAHKNGLIGAEGIAANSPREMLPNNMLREFFAEIKFLFSRPNTPLPMPAAGVRHVCG